VVEASLISPGLVWAMLFAIIGVVLAIGEARYKLGRITKVLNGNTLTDMDKCIALTKQKLEGIEEKLKDRIRRADVQYEKTDNSISRIHDRIDELNKDMASMKREKT